MKIKLICTLLLILLTIGNVKCQLSLSGENLNSDLNTYYQDFSAKQYPGLALLYSFLLPGAGQIYNKQYIKAAIFAPVYITSVVLFLALPSKYTYYSYYSYYYSIKEYWTGARITFLCVGGVTLLGAMADAYFSAKIINKNSKLSQFINNDNYKLSLNPTLLGLNRNNNHCLAYGLKLSMTIK